jgi:5-methylcytosine-specific restriction endonuclease McrA
MDLFQRRQIGQDLFYMTRGWRRARYMALKRYGRQCACCRRTPNQHSVALHVDHIVPRSWNPQLALNISNLQVLCEDCNLGKGASDKITWRPP